MGAKTGIEWTDATVNFWWGCTKVGPGCDICYAEKVAERFGGSHWGTGKPRRKIKGAVALMHRLDNDYSWWAADHQIGGHHATHCRRVFVQSMSDLFDLEAPLPWFDEAWRTIHACARIYIQIVTKRLTAIEKRLAEIGAGWPAHAGLIVSVTSQAEADRDIPRLLQLMERHNIPWIGISAEPLLGPITLPPEFLALGRRAWVIVGGESGKEARPMHPDWVRAPRDQCTAAGVPFFFKQWGEWLVGEPKDQKHEDNLCELPLGYADGHEFDVASDGDDIMLCSAQDESHGPSHIWRDYYGWQGHLIRRVGKKRAGRLLDGREWNELPEFQPAAQR